MKAKELIEKLRALDPDTELVMLQQIDGSVKLYPGLGMHWEGPSVWTFKRGLYCLKCREWVRSDEPLGIHETHLIENKEYSEHDGPTSWVREQYTEPLTSESIEDPRVPVGSLWTNPKGNVITIVRYYINRQGKTLVVGRTSSPKHTEVEYDPAFILGNPKYTRVYP